MVIFGFVMGEINQMTLEIKGANNACVQTASKPAPRVDMYSLPAELTNALLQLQSAAARNQHMDGCEPFKCTRA